MRKRGTRNAERGTVRSEVGPPVPRSDFRVPRSRSRLPRSAFLAIGLSLALQSPDPWPVLDHATAVYQTITSLSAAFTQVVANPMLGAPDTARGLLYQMRPSRF